MTSLSESGKATLIIPKLVQQTQDQPNPSSFLKYTQGCWAILLFSQLCAQLNICGNYFISFTLCSTFSFHSLAHTLSVRMWFSWHTSFVGNRKLTWKYNIFYTNKPHQPASTATHPLGAVNGRLFCLPKPWLLFLF